VVFAGPETSVSLVLLLTETSRTFLRMGNRKTSAAGELRTDPADCRRHSRWLYLCSDGEIKVCPLNTSRIAGTRSLPT
jgi:hypothetical protein